MSSLQLLMNPLTNPSFAPFMIRLLIVFVGAGLCLLVFQRMKAGVGSASSILWRRFRSWCIIALLFTSAAFSGPLTLAMLCAYICWQGGREYGRLTALPRSQVLYLILGGWLTLIATLLFGLTALMIAPVLAFFSWSVFMLRPLTGEIESDRRFSANIAGLWGYLYLGWLPAYLVVLSTGKIPGLVLVVGVGVALSDVGAFCTGKLIKGPKLAPRLSPNKTWGGVPGNILGAGAALALTSFVLPGLVWWQYGLFALVIGLGCIWGDLLESLLKRQRGVKDAGELLPGFGGLLDRIDSLLLVAPLTCFLTLRLFG